MFKAARPQFDDLVLSADSEAAVLKDVLSKQHPDSCTFLKSG